MKKTDEQKHYLAFKHQPGNHIYIDISRLSIAHNYHPSSLAELDSFTINFTTDEIINAIKEANIVDEKYYNFELCIADTHNHNPLPVITKDYMMGFNVESFIKTNLNNKNLLNTIVNKFYTLDEQIDMEKKFAFKNAIKDNRIEETLNIIFDLPYLIQRKYMVYMIGIHKKMIEKEQERIREKAS